MQVDDFGFNETSVQHLQGLRIGHFNVLFVAEVDAVNKYGPHERRTEVKSLMAPNWRQVMFQMIAKGSTKLVHGHVGMALPKDEQAASFGSGQWTPGRGGLRSGTAQKGPFSKAPEHNEDEERNMYLHQFDEYDLTDIVEWTTTRT